MPHDFESSLTIGNLSKSIRDGELSCAELLDRCLRKITDQDDGIRAWVVVGRDNARAQARELDAELSDRGPRGPLHGIPVGIKDIVDVAGLPTAAGFAPWNDRIADTDAPLVAKLRDAGAVIVGKTVTTQFACFDPPPTRNPWNAERTPGGSSSGSAAATAVGMCLAAIGSQTGGSITRPASYCAIYGCKPTIGKIPTVGVVPVSHTLDHPGPMARSVADLRIMMEVLTGVAGRKRCQEPFGRQKVPDTFFVGRLRGLFHDRAEPAMQTAFDAALAALAAAGVEVIDVPLPAGFDDVLTHHRVVMVVEMAEAHRQWYAESSDHYLPGVASLIREGMDTPAADYDQALRYRDDLCKAMPECFKDVDALVTPATTGPPPDPSTTGSPAFNAPWSFTGLPTVSMPMGWTEDKLPLALQLIGRTDDDFRLLRIAEIIEGMFQESGVVFE